MALVLNMHGSRNFCQGGPGPTAKKQHGLVLNLFYSLQRGPMVLLQSKLYFSKDQGGVQHFPGGGGGPNAYFHRNPYHL